MGVGQSSSTLNAKVKKFIEEQSFGVTEQERRKAFDCALLSNHVYDGKGWLPFGWTVHHKAMKKLKSIIDVTSDFHFMVYEKSGQLIVAFCGTRSIMSAVESVVQVSGTSLSYGRAISIARAVVGSYGVSKVLFTGHSLGGGLAQAAALATGAPAITFNPTWLSNATLIQLPQAKTPDIKNYVTFFEPLDVIHRFPELLERMHGTIIASIAIKVVEQLKPFGTFKYLYSPVVTDAKQYSEAHGIGLMVKLLSIIDLGARPSASQAERYVDTFVEGFGHYMLSVGKNALAPR
ncbi:putative Lipase (class 3) [Trypanosoma vivax]|uniref:Phospholipase, putative n=1 Tax=Trypanosoma vivax (strain Y486) TaxID=1055687 RepID=F9WUQ6_TRYVY|nr:putative phospholipase [Trypanosoma vivax]KAH8603944.1 putative Lipase (class 3) [Trypanosoma vivax]CCD21305.1 phospholipase, putative [Trypanosoma vivax Y486]|eukprot:CCD21305.1 phospholipase, putative [Trypanosoma vivax Y486]